MAEIETIKTSELPVSQVSDSLVGNLGGETYQVPTDSLAAQLLAGGPVAQALQDMRVFAVREKQLKAAVKVATTTAMLPATLVPGAIVDGEALVATDRVLLWTATNLTVNGIYDINPSGPATRSADANTADKMLGMNVIALKGTVNANVIFACDAKAPITIGTTALPFIQAGRMFPIPIASNQVTADGESEAQGVSPASLRYLLDLVLGGLTAEIFDRPGTVLLFFDRTGRIIFEVRDDGSAYIDGLKIVTEPPTPAMLEVSQRMYVFTYGDENSIDDASGEEYLRTYFPAGNRMPNVGLETFAKQDDVGEPAITHTIAFNPSNRERAIVPLLRAMSSVPSPLAGSEMIVDLAGRLGVPGQMARLGLGSLAFSLLIQNITTARNEAIADGKSFGIGAGFWDGGTHDWRAEVENPDDFTRLFRSTIDTPLRAALEFVTQGNPFPHFILPPATHGWRNSPFALPVVVGLSRTGRLPNNFVISPGYLFEHISGAALGWQEAHNYSRHGHRHRGMFRAKAWWRWMLTGSWRPLELKSVRVFGPRLIEARFHVPVPPMRISTETVVEVADGYHGLEVWSQGVRRVITNVTMTDDGTVSGEGRFMLRLSNPLSGAFRLGTALTSDIIGTPENDYLVGCQPGPKTGPRSTICDSDSLVGVPWSGTLINEDRTRYDPKNYATVNWVEGAV